MILLGLIKIDIRGAHLPPVFHPVFYMGGFFIL
nr:MAG TPA_asm: hypothetical protein [Caudoviricetes sp.]